MLLSYHELKWKKQQLSRGRRDQAAGKANISKIWAGCSAHSGSLWNTRPVLLPTYLNFSFHTIVTREQGVSYTKQNYLCDTVKGSNKIRYATQWRDHSTSYSGKFVIIKAGFGNPLPWQMLCFRSSTMSEGLPCQVPTKSPERSASTHLLPFGSGSVLRQWEMFHHPV